jgi:uncharacterized protein (DUF1800 family)
MMRPLPYQVAALTVLWGASGAGMPAPAAEAGTGPPGAARDSAIHVLNRLAYGPRPGQIDQIAQEGVFKWIEGQLASAHPSDPGLARAEPAYAILHLDQRELAERYGAARKAARDRQAGEADRQGDPKVRPVMMEEVRQLPGQLQELAVIRAVAAEFQLREIMADFWLNHFNVNLRKGADRILVPAYVERTIRPNVLGTFEDLLIATAQSPAMLFYLDNVQSIAPGAAPPGRGRRRFPSDRPAGGQDKRPTGINENYARELLELHTLGVDGGYSQQDVVNVARIFTGWGIRRPERGGGFEFREWAHDYGEKVVLGTRFPEGHGMDEGIRLLKLLANHPSTMHHVSRKLCARFVSDDPPDGCVDAAVAAWEHSRGDIRQVLLAIFRSPEFWAPQAAQSKIKTPLEFMVSALRAVGASPDSTPRVAAAIARLGEPLFLQASPAGYPETQEEWTNSGALLSRMTVAVALAAGRLPGVQVDLDRLVPATEDQVRLLDSLDQGVLGGRMSARTREVLTGEIRDLGDPEAARQLAVGLVLGSPEFQRQ